LPVCKCWSVSNFDLDHDLHPPPLQGHNFSLIVEATGGAPPQPVAGFGLLLNGCFLPEYYSAATPAAALDSTAARRWNLTLASLLSDRAAREGMNGWWVVPSHGHEGSVGGGWRVEVADEEERKKCHGGSCALWLLAATEAAMTTWSGHLHLASGTRPPLETRDDKWLYDLRVRCCHYPPLMVSCIPALCWS
jgi:hypothetical protein